MTITYRDRSPFADIYKNGYQSYCDGKTQRSNPFKHNPNSNEFKSWKMGFLNAKQVAQDSVKEGVKIQEIIESIKNRHKNK